MLADPGPARPVPLALARALAVGRPSAARFLRPPGPCEEMLLLPASQAAGRSAPLDAPPSAARPGGGAVVSDGMDAPWASSGARSGDGGCCCCCWCNQRRGLPPRGLPGGCGSATLLMLRRRPLLTTSTCTSSKLAPPLAWMLYTSWDPKRGCSKSNCARASGEGRRRRGAAKSQHAIRRHHRAPPPPPTRCSTSPGAREAGAARHATSPASPAGSRTHTSRAPWPA